jgi:hypothetical protein
MGDGGQSLRLCTQLSTASPKTASEQSNTTAIAFVLAAWVMGAAGRPDLTPLALARAPAVTRGGGSASSRPQFVQLRGVVPSVPCGKSASVKLVAAPRQGRAHGCVLRVVVAARSVNSARCERVLSPSFRSNESCDRRFRFSRACETRPPQSPHAEGRAFRG